MLDYLIKNAKVIDGTGKPAYMASVGVKGDQIAAIITSEDSFPDAKKLLTQRNLFWPLCLSISTAMLMCRCRFTRARTTVLCRALPHL